MKERIQKAIEEYNRYRGVEAKAKILYLDKDILRVEIRGSFCETCGYYDWIEDIVYILRDYDIDSELIRVNELDDGAIAEIKYKGEE
ncbi:MAG TPA: hypothetical protein EYH44_06115 [Thermoprotei archaeon]|nr:hypothetical protein [Thermoprotei archaeon]